MKILPDYARSLGKKGKESVPSPSCKTSQGQPGWNKWAKPIAKGHHLAE